MYHLAPTHPPPSAVSILRLILICIAIMVARSFTYPQNVFFLWRKVASHAEAGMLSVLVGIGNNHENKQGVVYEAHW